MSSAACVAVGDQPLAEPRDGLAVPQAVEGADWPPGIMSPRAVRASRAVTSRPHRGRGCGDQVDLVLPDQVENTLCIVWVDGEDVASPPSACLRHRRGLAELWSGVVVEWRCVHEKHVYPASPQLEGNGVPILDEERHAKQRQWVALTGRRGNRIERSKPKHACDPLLRGPAPGCAGRQASTSEQSISVASGSRGTPSPSTRQTVQGHRSNARGPAEAHAAALARGQDSEDVSCGASDPTPA